MVCEAVVLPRVRKPAGGHATQRKDFMATEVKRFGRLPFQLLLWAAIFGGAGWAADQPQWGERFTRNMVSEENDLPDTFDPKTGKNIRWCAPLGTQSFATPVIASGRVFIGTNNHRPRDPRHKGDRGVLLCLDEKDGSFCWQLVVPKLGRSPFEDWPDVGLCSPPTVEGDRVYVVTNRGEVACLDIHGMADGNRGPYRDEARHAAPKGTPPIEPGKTDADILWLFDILAETGVHQHDSAHASPLIDGQFLYVNTANGLNDEHSVVVAPDAPSLIVLDKATGRLLAREREGIGARIFHSTWSSPAIAQVNGTPLIVYCGGDGIVYAFEPLRTMPPEGQVAALKKVWSFDPDPAGSKERFRACDRNQKAGPSVIHGMPVVHGGRVYVAGGGDIWWGKPQSWLKCIDPAKGTEAWSYPLKRHVLATPAVRDGLAYIGDSSGMVHCVDASTGGSCWTQQMKGEIWASPLAADGKVYVATRRGDVWVFAAGRELKVLAQVELGEQIHGCPVAANGTLYIATMSRLYAFGK